jgi:hypothetical protein
MAQAAFGPGYYPICVVTRFCTAAPQLSTLLCAAQESSVPVLIFSDGDEVHARASAFPLAMCQRIVSPRHHTISPSEMMMRAAGLTTIWSSRCDLIETLARAESRRYFLTGALLWLDGEQIEDVDVAALADALSKTRECVRQRLRRGPIDAWIALPPRRSGSAPPAAMMCNALAAFILCDAEFAAELGGLELEMELERSMRTCRWTEEDVTSSAFWNVVELQLS